MNNSFGNIDFYELWLRYQVIVKKVALIGIVGIVVLLVILRLTSNPYKNAENSLLRNARDYIKNNNVDLTDSLYLEMLTLEENGYYVEYDNSINCDDVSGVLIEKINNEIKYTPYLMCDNYQSVAVKDIVNKKSDYLELTGNNPVVINDEESFTDPGYSNNSSYVIQVNNPVTDSPNLYLVEYLVKNGDEVKDSLKRIVISRQTNLSDSLDIAYSHGLKLKLNGPEEMTIEQGKKYEEQGAIATDRRDGDITSKIEILGSVDTSKVHDTTVNYRVTNSQGLRVDLKRTIHVVKPVVKMNITSQLSTSSYTNSDVTITLNINSPYYQRTILPSLLITYSSKITYKVSTNGTYHFRVYNTYGDYQEETVTVNNINKNPPSGSCTLTSSGNKSTVKVTGTSGIEIAGYSYSDGSTYSDYISSNQYVFNGNVSIAYVRIRDKAGNVKSISCKGGTTVITSGKVEYHFINSGRVDAILIRNGDHAAFVDGGWPNDGIKAVNYLKALGIKKLDFIIGSHSHLNHVGALGDVVNNFEVGAIYFVEDPLNCKNCNEPRYFEMAYRRVNSAMKAKGLTAIVQRKGDVLYLGSVKFECIAPINYSGYSANRNSLNHIVTFGNTTLLLTGDYMDSSALLNAYSADRLNVDILKYPHHGNYKITPELFNAISPTYVVAQNSSDELGRNAAASKSLMEKAGVKLYQNYIDGNIVITSDGKTIDVKTHADPSTFK